MMYDFSNVLQDINIHKFISLWTLNNTHIALVTFNKLFSTIFNIALEITMPAWVFYFQNVKHLHSRI